MKALEESRNLGFPSESSDSDREISQERIRHSTPPIPQEGSAIDRNSSHDSIADRSTDDNHTSDNLIGENSVESGNIVESIGRRLRWLGRGRKDQKGYQEPQSPKALGQTGSKFHKLQDNHFDEERLKDQEFPRHLIKPAQRDSDYLDNMNSTDNSRGLIVSPLKSEEIIEKKMQLHGQTPLTPTSPVSPTSDSSFTTSPPGSPPFVARVSMSPNRTTELRSAASAIAVSSNRPFNNIQGAPNSFSPTSLEQRPIQQAGAFPQLQANVPSLSPASSMIFERSVQVQQPIVESAWSTLGSEDGSGAVDAMASATNTNPINMAAKIPTHVLTEDHIPAVLEASTMAIARGEDPENVQIVTHAAHLSMGDSIGATAPGTGSSNTITPPAIQTLPRHSAVPSFNPPRPISPMQMLHSPLLQGIGEEKEEDIEQNQSGSTTTTTKAIVSPIVTESLVGSAYGASSLDEKDANSLRRLSFVSFADVVHGEQSVMPSGQGVGGPSPPSSSGYCSPVSSRGITKPIPLPATSSSGSGGGSPSLLATGLSTSGTVVGDLVYSNMSSAMRLAGRESTEC